MSKVFKHYLDFPSDVRGMVIDEMEPNDRCRFTRCSKTCNKEAKTSKKFIHALEIKQKGFHSEIIVICNGQLNYDDIDRYEHQRYPRKIGEAIGSGERGSKWKVREDRNGKFNNVRNISFQKLRIEVDFFDFELKSLPSLKAVHAFKSMSVLQFISKAERPLEEVSCRRENENNDQLANCEQIYQVHDYLSIPHLKLNNKQFLHLSVSKIEIHIGELTAEDIFMFVLLWQNGKICQNLQFRYWNLKDSNFDKPQLFKLFGVDINRKKRLEVKMKNHKDPAKKAVLICSSDLDFLRFATNLTDD